MNKAPCSFPFSVLFSHVSAIRFQPRYSIEDYLRWEGDWELWDGIPVAMSPSPEFIQGMACAALAEVLRRQLKTSDACSNSFVAVEIDWQVDRHTVVRPDLSVVCGQLPEQHILSSPALVAEFLSPATRHKDLTAKKALYAEEGVRFYVIGDPDVKELSVFHLTKRGRYEALAGEDLVIPPLQRSVVHLKLWEGFTFSRIAEVLEIGENTAASRYRLGLVKLRENLRPLYNEMMP